MRLGQSFKKKKKKNSSFQVVYLPLNSGIVYGFPKQWDDMVSEDSHWIFLGEYGFLWVAIGEKRDLAGKWLKSPCSNFFWEEWMNYLLWWELESNFGFWISIFYMTLKRRLSVVVFYKLPSFKFYNLDIRRKTKRNTNEENSEWNTVWPLAKCLRQYYVVWQLPYKLKILLNFWNGM